MHHLHSVVAVCERIMQHLHSVFAVCETTMQHLHSVFAVCEMTMQHLHSLVAVCETTTQHLHSVVAVCETATQHLHSVVAVCETIMQHLHSLFVMCAPTTGTIIHPCGMSGGRMLLCPYTSTRPTSLPPQGPPQPRGQSFIPAGCLGGECNSPLHGYQAKLPCPGRGRPQTPPLPIIRDCECVAPRPTFATLFLT